MRYLNLLNKANLITEYTSLFPPINTYWIVVNRKSISEINECDMDFMYTVKGSMQKTQDTVVDAMKKLQD